jgi:hypothetical protein
VRLRDKSDGSREICYLNTHWDHRGNQARVESAKIIRRWISEHAPDSLAIVTFRTYGFVNSYVLLSVPMFLMMASILAVASA